MTDQPERRRVPGQFITMDAAILAAQNERLDELNRSILALTESVSNRPTKYDLEKAQSRLRNQLVATIVVFSIFTFFLLGSQQALRQQCEDRNNNTAALRVLIVYLVKQTPDPGTNAALNTYLNTLVKIDC